MSEASSNHVLSFRAIREFLATHPGAAVDADAFRRWYKEVGRVRWETWADVRSNFATADKVGEHVVFNIGGNKYRIVCRVFLRPGNHAQVQIRHVFTHKGYDAWTAARR